MLRNSVRHAVRMPIKTMLFILLLVAITVISCLGINLWLSVNRSLDAANEAFKTIGVVEYRNPVKPTDDFTSYYDFSPLVQSGHVKSFDHRAVVPALSERLNTKPVGRHRWRNDVSVLEFTPVVSDGDLFQGRIDKFIIPTTLR